MKVTLNITKVLSVITENKVFNTKIENLQTVLKDCDEVVIKGWFSKSKLEKYYNVLISLGFSESQIYYKDVQDDKSIDFRILFTKQ
jgi:hypothetical protein